MITQPTYPQVLYTPAQQVIIASSTYILSASDEGKVLVFQAACTVTVPANLFDSFTAPIVFLNMSAGDVTINQGSGFTLSQLSGSSATITQYFFAKLRFLSGTTGVLSRAIDIPPAPGTDIYAGALYIFSTRKTRADQTQIVQVQRSSDSTSLWIGPDVDGDLDTAALLSFVGAGTGRVIGWKEPVTGRTATPTNTTGLLIVNSGTLITNSAGNPAVRLEPLAKGNRSLAMTIPAAELTFRSEFSVLMSTKGPSSFGSINERPFSFSDGTGAGGSVIGLRMDDRSLRFNNGFEVFSGAALTNTRNFAIYSAGTGTYSASRFFEGTTENATSSSSSGPGNATDITDLVIGGYRSGTGAIEGLDTATVDVSEFVVYSGYLSDTDRNAYGVTLAAYNGGTWT